LQLLFPFSGVELVLGTGVKSADVKRKTLLTTTGETISYKILIVATGARVLKQILKFKFPCLKESVYLVILHPCRAFQKTDERSFGSFLDISCCFLLLTCVIQYLALKIHENIRPLKHHIETLKKLLSSLTYFICGID
jgi:hypothetical protein